MSERLIVQTQVEIGRPGEEPLVTSGRLVGFELGPGGHGWTGYRAEAGRPLRGGDSGRPVAVLDASFATFHDLPDDREPSARRRHVPALHRPGSLA